MARGARTIAMKRACVPPARTVRTICAQPGSVVVVVVVVLQ